MNNKIILKIAKKSAKSLGLPKRTPIKNYSMTKWCDFYCNVLWIGVKCKLVSFYKWEAYCFNREYY